MALTKISGQVAPYAWGGTGAISALLGWPESATPEAEWWLGTHPLRPSVVTDSGDGLGQWLARQGERSELGFLFKILAPVAPLSLQVHPTTAQAESGWEREEQAGVPLTSPLRNFKDRSAKPELVVALGRPFHALAGLRDPASTIELLESLDPANHLEVLSRWRRMLATQPLGEVIRWLLSGGEEVSLLLVELAGVASRNQTLELLMDHYPGDPGVAVAMMLNRVTLEPGEALFLDAGQLHAYLEGTAIEVMAPSDNVIRGGLTEKHVDVDTLLDIASDSPGDPPFLWPTEHRGVSSYLPPDQAFGLHSISSAEQPLEREISSPTIWVATEGSWRLGQGDSHLELTRGEAAVLAGSNNPVTLQGTGCLWWASPR